MIRAGGFGLDVARATKRDSERRRGEVCISQLMRWVNNTEEAEGVALV
jgi:hypothetical protein